MLGVLQMYLEDVLSIHHCCTRVQHVCIAIICGFHSPAAAASAAVHCQPTAGSRLSHPATRTDVCVSAVEPR